MKFRSDIYKTVNFYVIKVLLISAPLKHPQNLFSVPMLTIIGLPIGPGL
jgi:hypothetical protein